MVNFHVSNEDQAHGAASLYGILNNVQSCSFLITPTYGSGTRASWRRRRKARGQQAAARVAYHSDLAQLRKEQAGA